MEIRRLRRGEGDQLRGVRLRALADAPYAFSSSLGREVEHAPEFWQSRAEESEAGKSGAIFVAIDGDQDIGMAGAFVADEGVKVVALWGMWVDPVKRGGGVGQLLIEAVADWAQNVGATELRLAVTDCDETRPAAALYRKLGFVDTGDREPLEWNPALITWVLSRSLPATD